MLSSTPGFNIDNFDLSKLPSLSLFQKDCLPDCPAVYFAVDSENRVLYIGQATNLLARWQDHHRFEQLNTINRKNKIKLAWLICSCDRNFLSQVETYFIGLYQPLLNKTPVPAKKIIPSEIGLQQTLSKLSKYVVVLGIDNKQESDVPTVYLKYDWLYKSPIRIIRSIFKADNKKPSGLRWSEYCRRQYSFWRATCNGVAIDIAPWNNIGDLREKAAAQKLAGVDMMAICEPEFTDILLKNPFLKEQLPGLSVLEHDPIPLLWSKYSLSDERSQLI